jgi:hypothetical protein
VCGRGRNERRAEGEAYNEVGREAGDLESGVDCSIQYARTPLAEWRICGRADFGPSDRHSHGKVPVVRCLERSGPELFAEGALFPGPGEGRLAPKSENELVRKSLFAFLARCT